MSTDIKFNVTRGGAEELRNAMSEVEVMTNHMLNFNRATVNKPVTGEQWIRRKYDSGDVIDDYRELMSRQEGGESQVIMARSFLMLTLATQVMREMMDFIPSADQREPDGRRNIDVRVDQHLDSSDRSGFEPMEHDLVRFHSKHTLHMFSMIARSARTAVLAFADMSNLTINGEPPARMNNGIYDGYADHIMKALQDDVLDFATRAFVIPFLASDNPVTQFKEYILGWLHLLAVDIRQLCLDMIATNEDLRESIDWSQQQKENN